MKLPKSPVVSMLFFSALILLLILLMQPWELFQFQEYIAVLFPAGEIAREQRDLLLIIQAIMLLVVIPVYGLTYYFSWKYRSDNRNSKYDPDLVDSVLAEFIWWGLPFVLTAIVCVITAVKTYQLDPYKSIASDNEEMTIQVVALDWKWLFIYPEEKIATVNFVQFPKDTPIRFLITADAPMNSFWIPHLGGQIYAMPNMKTELNLIANEIGDFRGLSANISGVGFSGMTFIARASSVEEYKRWVEATKQSSKALDLTEYKRLAAPSENNPKEFYLLTADNLFNHILMKYMHPQGEKLGHLR